MLRIVQKESQAEGAAYVEAHADQFDQHGHRLVVRNGHRGPRAVSATAGAGPVRAPRINDKRIDDGERPAPWSSTRQSA